MTLRINLLIQTLLIYFCKVSLSLISNLTDPSQTNSLQYFNVRFFSFLISRFLEVVKNHQTTFLVNREAVTKHLVFLCHCAFIYKSRANYHKCLHHYKDTHSRIKSQINDENKLQIHCQSSRMFQLTQFTFFVILSIF